MEPTPDLSQLKKLAQTPAGQELLQLVQKNSQGTLEQALAQAQNGDYRQIQALVQGLLASEKGQALLRQLEGMS